MDYVKFLNWNTNSTKQSFEGIAEATGVPMPEIEPPRAMAATLADDVVFAMNMTCQALGDSEPFSAYQRTTPLDALAYTERLARYGGYMTAEYLAGAERFLGMRPSDVAEAGPLLDMYVQEVGAEQDDSLFAFLASDALRLCFLLAIPGSNYADGLRKQLVPIK